MATAAAPPHLFWVGKDRESVRGWPRGSSLLEMLGDINADVQDALAGERARLREHGYPEDLPLPALWWSPAASAKDATERPLLAAIGAAV
jgi:hypothetical protein